MEETAVDEVLEEAAVLDVPDVAVVDDVLLIPSADSAASSADNSGFDSVELVDEDDEDAAASRWPPPWRCVAPTEGRSVPVGEPLTLCMLMVLDPLTS
ncbi:hypothetical protein BCY88_07375 [Paraburkholderia fungorum]|uniref:Uncharacterized protein n=1 Tax=Paraburkholderia fungorum TaxID=134537 RepID=A0A3R7E359_9BURK|nr:hypothetical protein BCY88_07375 [Paraburkholderia fungorum]